MTNATLYMYAIRRRRKFGTSSMRQLEQPQSKRQPYNQLTWTTNMQNVALCILLYMDIALKEYKRHTALFR